MRRRARRCGARRRSKPMTAVSFPARRAYSTTRSRSASAIRVRFMARWVRTTRPPANGCGAGKPARAVARYGTPSRYDPEVNRLYVGTGNARGAERPNRFACSVVALNADTGEMAWHYDAAPGDHQQCDGSTDITLATINIDGQPRKVILHAPKDGSFHVLDRATGKLISSKKLGVGAHNHFAQSFSPKTGLVYLPTTELPDSNPEGDAPANAGKSALVAWDPVKQRAAWAIPTQGAYSGGVLVDRRRSRVPGAGRRLHHGVFRRRGSPRVGVLFGGGRARRAHQLCRRQAPIHLDPQRPHAGRGRKSRRHVGEIRLGFTRASTAPPDLRARRHGRVAADAGARRLPIRSMVRA